MKYAKAIVVLVLVVFAVQGFMLASTMGLSEIDKGTLKVHGSNTVFPVTTRLQSLYEYLHPGVTVEAGGEGSGVGYSGLLDGLWDIAAASRAPKSTEIDKANNTDVMLILHTVGIDGLSVFTHPDNPVGELTIDEISSIYNGTYKYWDNVTTDTSFTADARIKVIERDANSGTHDYFNEFFLDKEEVPSDDLGNNYYAQYQSTADLVNAVAETTNAIGYGGVSYLVSDVEKVAAGQDPDDVRPLKVIPEGGSEGDGILPQADKIKSNEYPVSRPLFFVTKGTPDPNSAEGAWVNLAKSLEGQTAVEQAGYVSFFDDPQNYNQVFFGYEATAAPGFEAIAIVLAIGGIAGLVLLSKKKKQTEI